MDKHTILLVDDEKNILSSISRLLHSDDREIITAENSREALDKLKSIGPVDLVISDNRLPDFSGIDFLIKVKHLYPDTIRILITGYPDLESVIHAINKGQVYRFITKPWDNEEVKIIVKQALDFYDVLKDNRSLLRIARQQAELLKSVKQKYPDISQAEFDKSSLYIIEEKVISENLSEFMQKYYIKDNKESKE
ncbi:MAG: response regulator [Candidatus Omnitrophota bacterium]|nr:response regulator [Candidatus Omnitrophota bacterium]MBU1929489.1 response regulator [Candidatus Omnitrophota bacterium]MBU2034950.1 response regulator [Candidatus Omnitrophota bacterium]MBU2221711.1 response regulator [Candidatus Omnitrophota bacterium]MBU2258893.1 response regulator [Candidatus Omnitrophota bacterium]